MRTGAFSRWAFAASILAIGVLGVVAGDAVAAFAPLSKKLPAREILAYASALVSIACGVGLLIPATRRFCSRLLLAVLGLWLLVFRAPLLFRWPLSAVSFESCGELAVMVAGAWALVMEPAGSHDGPSSILSRGGLRACNALYGLAMLAFGTAHFAYVRETAGLIPDWIPLHAACVYFTGASYIAAGVAILAGILAYPAAALCALQMGLFSVLVWVPLVAKHPHDFSQWSELVLSFALAASGWVIADSLLLRSNEKNRLKQP